MDVTKSMFEGRVGEMFRLDLADVPALALTLTEVNSPGERILKQARERGAREPFSLLFRGPSEPALPQHMYSVGHDELGQVEVFLVPVDQDERGYYYEAIFG